MGVLGASAAVGGLGYEAVKEDKIRIERIENLPLTPMDDIIAHPERYKDSEVKSEGYLKLNKVKEGQTPWPVTPTIKGVLINEFLRDPDNAFYKLSADPAADKSLDAVSNKKYHEETISGKVGILGRLKSTNKDGKEIVFIIESLLK